ncbi:MAG: hydrogenase nickel incorporation protein HypA [Methanomassiliicoccaceae archaeon]|nr:hydrogenase nickel incorporation protein HypA [Methanomassiliicoccaceae archaeon]
MSGHDHEHSHHDHDHEHSHHGHSHHDHDHNSEDCHCDKCEEEREKTSIEEAGGVAVGLTGHIHGYNADVAARFSKVLLTTGKWVEKESGSLLGHIKAAIYDSEGKGLTLNLTNLENGVEQHGTLPPQERAEFNFMSAVLDVDPHELEHVMMDALEDSGIDLHLKDHHHHDHEHHGHHDHEEHGHKHNDKNEVCHCEACEDRRQKEAERAEKGSLWDKIRRRKK